MITNWLSIDEDLKSNLKKYEPKLFAEVESISTESVSVSKDEISEFKVYQRQKNKKISNSISVSPFFKGDGSYEDFDFKYFAGAFSDRYRFISGMDSSIIAERFGFGIEIILEISKINSSVRGGFGFIAAAAEMGLAEVEYEYHVRALPEGQFHNFLPKVGKFEFQTIKKFRDLVDKLKELYYRDINNFDLVAIEVLMATSVYEDDIENASSYYFAARKVIEQKSLKQTITQARNYSFDFNEDAIRYLYSRVGVGSIEEPPSNFSINNAKKIIFEQ